jgi:hypothetical protein
MTSRRQSTKSAISQSEGPVKTGVWWAAFQPNDDTYFPRYLYRTYEQANEHRLPAEYLVQVEVRAVEQFRRVSETTSEDALRKHLGRYYGGVGNSYSHYFANGWRHAIKWANKNRGREL